MLTDKIILVTGASRGIGKACLEMLAKNNAFVIGTATSEAGAKNIENSLSAHKLKGIGVALDICQPEQVTALFERIKKDYGRLDVLVNNAGITRDNIALRMNEAQWSAVIDTNLSATFFLSKAALRLMVPQKQGRIISITSVIGFIGNVGQANYAAAKAGLIALSKSLAKEVGGRGILINTVAPGFIETDMTKDLSDKAKQALLDTVPLKRLGQADDVAEAVLFLAGVGGNYITGQTLHINGGLYMA